MISRLTEPLGVGFGCQVWPLCEPQVLVQSGQQLPIDPGFIVCAQVHVLRREQRERHGVRFVACGQYWKHLSSQPFSKSDFNAYPLRCLCIWGENGNQTGAMPDRLFNRCLPHRCPRLQRFVGPNGKTLEL